MRFSTTLLFAIVTAFVLALPVTGVMAAPPEGKKAKKVERKKRAEDRGAGERKKTKPRIPRNMPTVQELDAIEIIGRIQKPEVFYVLGRTDFSYKGLTLKSPSLTG